MFRWKKAAAVIAAASAFLLSACGGGNSTTTAGSSTGGGTLTLGLLTQATTFSAADMNWANESPYGQAVYDGLVRANPDGTIVPWLATKWSYDSTKTALTMTLRTDVKFTDGTAFDATVAAQNLLRFRDGNSPNKSLLALVKDAKAVNSDTLEIDLKEPDPALLSSLSQNAGLEESPKAFNSADIKTVPVGSGPYTLDSADTVIGSTYTFVKNTSYWAPNTVHYDKIVMNVYSDATALLNAIKAHQVNAANTIDNSAVDQIKAAGFNIDPLELNWTGLILFDRNGTMNKALGDVRVRQAINYAFDTSALLKAVGKGYGTTTTQVFPTNSPGYDKSLDSYYTYNPTKAKQLLSEAGYPNGFTLNMPSTTLIAPATFTLVKQQLAAIGITVKYTDAGNNFITDMLAPKYPATYMILQEDPTAWQILNFSLLPTATFNPFHVNDPKIVSLAKTIQTGTEAQASTATKELDKYIVEQAWFAPWYRMQSSFVSDANTQVTVQQGNAYPYLWNFKPAA